MHDPRRLPLLVVALLLNQPGAADSHTDMASATATHTVRITVRVPADAPTVYVAGNLPQLGPWQPAALEVPGSGSDRTVTLEVPHNHQLRFKVTAGSWEREGLGPSGEPLPEFSALVDDDAEFTAEIAGFREDPDVLIDDWRGADVRGELVYWKNVESAFLEKTRHVVTWLPPGYDAKSQRGYRVIYVHDGQNIFDPRLAYTNVDWGIDEAMVRGMEARLFEPAVVVGIWNTADRLTEYSPWHDADRYARFIVDELMPRIEATFNVRTGPENTFVMGSSMGGLVSFYLVSEHPDVFGACGCVSSHLSWSEQMLEWHLGRDPGAADATPYILRDIAAGKEMPAGVRLYFDYGTEGLDAAYAGPHAALKEWLLAQGYTENRNLKVKQFDGAGHDEASWRARVGDQLEWLLGDGIR